MKTFTCVVCPNGCHLTVDEATGAIRGNRCVRGITYAQNEMTHPMRSLTTTVRTSVPGWPVVSVRTDGEIPKDQIFALMKALADVRVHDLLPLGSIVLKDALATGINVITTTAMTKE